MGLSKIEYLETNTEGIDVIKPLWEKLNEHHLAVSHYFKDHHSRFTFQQRKRGLLEKTRTGELHIDLARDPTNDKYVGYCVSSLTGEKLGEIESIYVDPEYRRSGIGNSLMQRALCWMADNQTQRKIVGVAEGNESVFPFYRHHGFYPRITILEQKEDTVKGDQ